MKNIMDDILLRDVDNTFLGDMDATLAPTRLRSISLYDGSMDLSPEALYDHDGSSELPSFPTLFVIHDQGELLLHLIRTHSHSHLVGNGGGVSNILRLTQ